MGRRMRVGGVLGVLAVVACGCYQDYDFDADHRADYVVVDPSDERWIDLESGAVLFQGQDGDIPVPGDWDGNHLADVAVVRGDTWITQSGAGTFVFAPPPNLPALATSPALPGVHPVPADYDGDGELDAAWYRDGDATWFIRGRAPIQFGRGPTATVPRTGELLDDYDYDFPVPADYDGDGIDDLSTFNPLTRAWVVRHSTTGIDDTVVVPGDGLSETPVPADYDGLGHAQRSAMGFDGWWIEGHAGRDPFGSYASIHEWAPFPAVADYDGDNRADRSYVPYDGGTWRTAGSPTTYEVTDPWIDGPVAISPALHSQHDRLYLVGRCSVGYDDCT